MARVRARSFRTGFTSIGADGRRHFTWRVWLLIWLAPGLFAAAAAALAVEAFLITRLPQTEGEVVRVYSREGTSVLDYGETAFAPVFRYTWTDGRPTEASTAVRKTGWDFAIGTRMPILYDPKVKSDVHLPGPHNWLVAQVIGLMALVLAVPALWLHRRARRWEARWRT